MHPALALWIWSTAMMRAWQTSWWPEAPEAEQQHKSDKKPAPSRAARHPILVRASEYLYSEIPESPLPDSLLDRLADLYWVERDAHLGI